MSWWMWEDMTSRERMACICHEVVGGRMGYMTAWQEATGLLVWSKNADEIEGSSGGVWWIWSFMEGRKRSVGHTIFLISVKDKKKVWIRLERICCFHRSGENSYENAKANRNIPILSTCSDLRVYFALIGMLQDRTKQRSLFLAMNLRVQVRILVRVGSRQAHSQPQLFIHSLEVGR